MINILGHEFWDVNKIARLEYFPREDTTTVAFVGREVLSWWVYAEA